MCILTIDLGTKLGWCARTGGATISDTLDLKGSRYEGGGMRFLRFRSWLEALHKDNPVRYVAFEEVRGHKGTDAAHIYGGLMAVLTAFCEEHKIPYVGIPVQTIKKFVTGKGNADKTSVIAAVRKFGFSPKDDNEADAVALMLHELEKPEVQQFLAA